MAEGLTALVDEMQGRIGQESTPGDWMLVTQDMVNQFADVTGDHQFIHVDPERAKGTPFKGTIAHGFLTLSLCLTLPRYRQSPTAAADAAPPPPTAGGNRPQMKMAVNYGLNRVRFPAPVPVGKHVRAKSKLVSVEAVAPDTLQSVTQITIEVEGSEKPAAVIELVGRQYY
ncbi:MAG TPA: MaoC family dehydratase [Chloroflexota bacterium]|nr:MaoC family dehydratase [Chloroflexota bacterium]